MTEEGPEIQDRERTIPLRRTSRRRLHALSSFCRDLGQACGRLGCRWETKKSNHPQTKPSLGFLGFLSVRVPGVGSPPMKMKRLPGELRERRCGSRWLGSVGGIRTTGFSCWGAMGPDRGHSSI